MNVKPTPFVNLNNPMELVVITFWAGKWDQAVITMQPSI